MTASGSLQPVGPIHTVHLFADLHADLVSLLRDLSPDDWSAPTVCDGWSVHDVAAHLLGGDLFKVSGLRDGHRGPPPPYPLDEQDALLRFINHNNATFVTAMRRVSPRILVAWIDEIGREVPPLLAALDPDAPSGVPVSWAGDVKSPNWFDIAREFTERWHHQQHIRDAVGCPDFNPRYLAPVLDTFLRALPFTYRDIAAEDGATVCVTIDEPAGGAWTLQREQDRWALYHGAVASPDATIRNDADTAWRLFTKGITASTARNGSAVTGDPRLALSFFHTVSIIA